MPIRRAVFDDADTIGLVHVKSWQANYDHIFDNAWLAQLDPVRRADWWRAYLGDSDTLAFVAENDVGKIVGFASAGDCRTPSDIYTSELYAIYLLKSAIGQGLGSQLFDAVCSALVENGHQHMLLWVLEDNAVARRFYEHKGGQPILQKEALIGETMVTERAMGFDLSKLVQATS